MTEKRIVAPERTEDDTLEASLRPKRLAAFVGQQQAREILSIFIDAAKARAEALDHVLFHGPPGLDDQIAVHSVLTGMSGARINVVQKIYCGEMLLVEGRIEACMITLTGKLRRLPKNVLETLAPYVTAEET